MELLVQEMDKENEGDADNLDDYLMGFSTNRTTSTWMSTHSPIQVACAKIFCSRHNCRNSCYGDETSDYFGCDPIKFGQVCWLGKLELNN
jgi:hypothetical protein